MAYCGRKRAANRRPSKRRVPQRSHLDTDLVLPVSSSARPLHNLPIQVTSFIGREFEIAEIKQALPRTRLLTLTGSGGCGKTRLALQVAVHSLDSYADGVWLVDFAPLSDPALVPQTVASALSVPEQPGRPLVDSLVKFLRPKSSLLLLDNCEHLVAACGQLADMLLQSCPTLQIVATSRERLGIGGELAYRVPSLSLPRPGHPPSLELLVQSEAVRLFIERASFSQAEFRVTSSILPAIVHVCTRLDGIPLAIELAAGRLKALTVEQIAARLEDRFGLLTGGSRTALPRYRTLRAAMDWSYDLLADSERTLLRRIAVFAGGWTLGAAEAVCSGNGVDSVEILDLLTQLVDKSLVVVEMQKAESRYRLLETVRQYARDRLLESKESEEVFGRHLDFFLRLAQESEPKLEGPEQTVWATRLQVEQDNLRAALEWSIKNKTRAGLRLAGALGRFWIEQCDFTEGYRWLGEALKISGSTAERAKALNAAGSLAVRRGDYATDRSLLEEALSIYRELEDKRGLADAIYNLGYLAAMQEDYTSARSFFSESLAIHRELGHKLGIAEALGNLGHVAWHQGDHASARPLLEESLARSRELGQGRLVVLALWSLGLVAFDQGNHAEACSFYHEALVTAQPLRDPYLANTLESCAGLAATEGQPERAARLLGAATAFRKATDTPRAPAHISDYERPLTLAHAALSEEVFNTAWGEGEAMTLEQAIEHALKPTETSLPQAKGRETDANKEASLVTPREQQVMTLIARGLTNREIASQLEVTERTAETHVRNILNKLKVNSRTQIALWAVAHGFQSPSAID